MRWIALAMLMGCGGSNNSLIEYCDPCLSAPGPAAHVSVDGDSLTCTCASGGGSQTYKLVTEVTTYCADNHEAWMAYSIAHCR